VKLARFSVIAAAWLAVLPLRARAAIVDANFAESPFASVGTNLTSMAWAPDGSNRLFVTIKTGHIRIVENGALIPTSFDLVAPLFRASECGLLGLAFDPDFTNNGYLYVFVTVSNTEQQVIRYKAVGNTATDKTTIVAGLPTRGANHDGGALGFGPDGKLYWAIGDNGGPRVGVDADLLSLAAKVGRANRDGSVPSDNPFYDGDGPNNDYIWARGFRNPFTMAFQPATGRLWLNVVGNGFEQVFTPLAGESGGWDNYENNQLAGFITPVIAYNTNTAPPRPITATGAVRSADVVTITTTAVHKFRAGAKVTIAGVVDPSFDGTFYIASAAPRNFTYAQQGDDAASGSGTATPPEIGGSITGGAFWDSSAVPAAYEGDFFFGDYNSGRIMRAELGDSSQVVTLDEWGNGLGGIVDMALGPDGDMYYGLLNGNIFRGTYNSSAQGIIVSRRNVRLAEGGSAAFEVRLAQAPTTNQIVRARWLAGDVDVSVLAGDRLVFTAANWSTPQPVLLGAAQDVDSIEDAATIRVNLSGVPTQIVKVLVSDDESFAVVVSPTALEVNEGDSAELQVSLTQPPPASLEVAVTLNAGNSGAELTDGALLSFDASNWQTPQLVTVSAAEDADGEGGTAKLTLSAAGLSDREVEVTVHDNDETAPTFTSTPIEKAVLGVLYTYDADAEGLPEPVFVLDEAPAGMTLDPGTGMLEWTPAVEGPVSVTLLAQNGLAPDAVQSFNIVVEPDQAPTCSLTAPKDGAVISGAEAEFFWDVTDDVGAVRAEFSIDGEMQFEDVNEEGHYHYGGSHNLFDTTLLAEGEHTLTLEGYDTAGQSCVAEVVVTVDNVDDGGAGGESGMAGSPAEPSGGAPNGGGAAQPMGGGPPAQADAGEPGVEQGGEPASDGAGPSDGAKDSGGCDCRAAGLAGAPAPGMGLVILGCMMLAARRAKRRYFAIRTLPR
jgi:glucose/arabinose dehydrogenase